MNEHYKILMQKHEKLVFDAGLAIGSGATVKYVGSKLFDAMDVLLVLIKCADKDTKTQLANRINRLLELTDLMAREGFCEKVKKELCICLNQDLGNAKIAASAPPSDFGSISDTVIPTESPEVPDTNVNTADFGNVRDTVIPSESADVPITNTYLADFGSISDTAIPSESADVPITNVNPTQDSLESDKSRADIPPSQTTSFLDDEASKDCKESAAEVYFDAEEGNQFDFSPKALDDFIGQVKVIKQLKDAITEAKMDGKKCIADKGGILFLGSKGLGKSTIMELTAKELGVEYEFLDASSFKRDTASRKNFDMFLERIAKKNVPVVIAIDEIHELPPDIQSRLLVLIQGRVYTNLVNGQVINLPMPEFTFMAATTDQHGVLDTVYDRFGRGLICELAEYSEEELRRIIIKKAAHFGLRISDGAIGEIVPRGRSSLRDIEAYILKLRRKARLSSAQEINTLMAKQLFDELGIDRSGLYAKDREILEALHSSNNYTLSEDDLVSKVRLKIENYQKFIKPYLVQGGYIFTTSKGQSLTEKALEYLKNCDNADTNTAQGGQTASVQTAGLTTAKVVPMSSSADSEGKVVPMLSSEENIDEVVAMPNAEENEGKKTD